MHKDDIAVTHNLPSLRFRQGEARSHSRAVMMVVDDSSDESAVAVLSDVL